MPIYQCYCPRGLLTITAKAEVAGEITTIHCQATGAPEAFVNVLFHEISAGNCFVAREPSDHSYLFGHIRHGRDLQMSRPGVSGDSRSWEDLGYGTCQQVPRRAS
ncbi:hypothetical protein MSAS_27910 [Mycobacterium saskatchewanense]|uniref:tautomerase family protein n=1 Tax=Mycobacterium saskatchewanense TaxID=220927 RepID=UPI00138D1C39|nr:tautomerase family protein [Mycobacterium saskatchewanense]BBX63617.1 hypothetical protein MSAS_27910 [Mycobacterium saskatchewanense]